VLLERLGIWPARVTWFLLPLLVGPVVASGLDTRSGAVQVVAEAMMWAAWFIGLVSLLAPSTVSLTVYRILAPGSVVAVALAIITGEPSNRLAALALLDAALATGIAFLALTGDKMVNGSAYGPERRLALRPPASLLIGPIVVAWVALAVPTTAGPLLLASGRWVLGVPVSALAVVIAYFVGRSLHQLSRRWIVFTPAGFVIHDYFVLAESILLKRQDIAELGPAPAEPRGTLDLSAGALGLAIQIEAKEPLSVVIRDRKSATVTDSVRFIFSPSLPGQLLREARVRGISIS
jgi:hydrogenase-4 membrane subunit HyfE